MKKLFFVRSGSTCRMLRILAAAMLLLPVNLQPVRASRQDAGAKSSLTVKMKDATLSSVFAEVERTSRYAFIYTAGFRFRSGLRPSTNCCPRSSRERS